MLFRSCVGHASELPRPGDFRVTRIGLQSVIMVHGADGEVRVLMNRCRHRGVSLTESESGNQKHFVCPYHGWAYDSSGKNVDIKDRAAGAYAPAFDAENHDLLPVAKVASYKGMIFGCLSADAPDLETHLGDLRFFLDLHMDQGEHGMEVIPGRALYSYRGNWKMQMENGQDAYHFSSTHASLVDLQQKRLAQGKGNTDARSFDIKKRASMIGGTFEIGRAHV